MLLKKTITLLAMCLALPMFVRASDADSVYEPFAPDGIPFCVADEDWNPDSLGNHRAVVRVDAGADVPLVSVRLPWRRTDHEPEKKGVVVVVAATGQKIAGVCLVDVSADEGTVCFPPVKGQSLYYIYYMPYRFRQGSYDARYEPGWNDYLNNGELRIENGELAAHEEPQSAGNNSQFSIVNSQLTKVLRFESRNRFEFMTSMGIAATKGETEVLRQQHTENPVIFTEDRLFPIRLTRQLPVRWVGREPADRFEGTAGRGEYYVWQVGLWAAHAGLTNVRLTFSDWRQQSMGAVIGAEAMTCFNQEGTNWDGKPLSFVIDVPADEVKALWCGVQIPDDAPAGDYTGQVTLTADGMAPRRIGVLLHVLPELVEEKGDNDLWRLSRLRWLNSRIGEDDHPVAPYAPMKLRGKAITASGKKVAIGPAGLPSSVTVHGQEVLAEPVRLEVETAGGIITMDGGKTTVHQEADGLVTWQAQQQTDGLALTCVARMEYDGYLHFDVALTSATALQVKDIRLVTRYTAPASRYFMGIGYDGGSCPEEYVWNWTGPYDSYWIGGTEAGLHVEFRGGSYHGPLLNDYKPAPPAVWANGGQGRIAVSGTGQAQVTAGTGAMMLGSEPVHLELALNITPVKPLDTAAHFSRRFYHGSWRNFDHAATEGANICNIHHATDLNPVINYPFIVQDSLKAFVDHEHAEGRKVKLYYTIRELTDHVAEIYALKSLGSEILAPGPGRGAPWLCEHLIDGYRPAWYVTLADGTVDAAFVLSPHSRWINYYLEGLRWMLQHYGIDGLYMDDVSFDRTVMKRMRKIMAAYRPGSLIDLHSNTGYSRGPANQYTEFFPYIDRLWFGESFRYDAMTPDEWLVTFSGIPFGLMSEMLQDGGNRWLGMVYGATNRHSYGPSPAPVWQLWHEFGIEDARMIGYWDDQCPVTPSSAQVKATAYVAKGRTLIALANFGNDDTTVTLRLSPQLLRQASGGTLYAPPVSGYQDEHSFPLGTPIPVPAKRGWLLLVK